MILKDICYNDLNSNNCDKIINFIRKENFNYKINSNYLRWWYLNKNFSSSTFVFSEYNDEILSIATINNFNIIIDNKIISFGMAQNVITAKKFRGMGLFNDTFNECEKQNNKKNILNYITFTNSQSTPIFLKKFGYSRGSCPEIVVMPIFLFFTKLTNLKKVNKFNRNFLNNYKFKSQNHSLYKNKEYLLWRYEATTMNDLHILEFTKNNLVEAYAIIKFSFRKKIKICYLLETVGNFNKHYIKQLKKYVFKNNSYFLLLLKNDKMANIYKLNIKLKIKNKFNFLVKSNETKDLSKIKFNLTFGDIDFMNYI
jgi:hypothetical protein